MTAGLTIIDAGRSTTHGVHVLSGTYVLVYDVFRNKMLKNSLKFGLIRVL